MLSVSWFVCPDGGLNCTWSGYCNMRKKELEEIENTKMLKPYVEDND